MSSSHGAEGGDDAFALKHGLPAATHSRCVGLSEAADGLQGGVLSAG